MKLLKKTIEYKGFIYLQEYRNENYAIYSQWLNNDLIAYELIKITKNKNKILFGKQFEESERYPTDKMWGDYGWAFETFLEAQKRLLVYVPELSYFILPSLAETLSPPKSASMA